MTKKYKIYLLTFPNNKKYCGYTSQELTKRWNNGSGYQKCPLVYKAILKYGWDNVKKELLYSFDSAEEALQKEKEMISKLNLTNPEFGYNLHPGGKPVGASSFLTEEGRKKISETHKKYWSNPEYRAKMLEKRKNQRPSELCIKKGIAAAALAHKGKIPKNAKPVLQLDLKTSQIIAEYPSATHASLAIKGEPSGATNILKVCKGQRKSAYNYKWRFKNA